MKITWIYISAPKLADVYMTAKFIWYDKEMYASEEVSEHCDMPIIQ